MAASPNAGLHQSMKLRPNPSAPGSIVTSLFAREIFGPGPRKLPCQTPRLEETMIHQLIKSRASAALSDSGNPKIVNPVACVFQREQHQAENGSGNGNNSAVGNQDAGGQDSGVSDRKKPTVPARTRWFRVKVKPRERIPSFVDNFLVLQRPNTNCLMFYEMCPFVYHTPLCIKYTIREPTFENWKKLCIWRVSPFRPMTKRYGRLPPESNRLMLLRGTTVCCYDLYNGNQIESLDLTFDDGPPNYSDISVDDETGLVLVKASAGAVKVATQKFTTPMIQELIILGVPPLVILYRLLFPLSVWPQLHVFEVMKNVGIAKQSSEIDIFDLRALISSNLSAQDKESCSDVDVDIFSGCCTVKTITLHKKAGHLTAVRSKCREIQFMAASQPPCVVLTNQDFEFELYSLDNLQHPVKVISAVDFGLPLPAEQYQLLFSTKDDIMRFHLESTNDEGYFLIQDYNPTTLQTLRSLSSVSVKQILDSTESTKDRRGSGEGRRKKKTENECFGEDLSCTAVNKGAGLLAVCTLTGSILNAMIYHNDTLELIVRLNPVTVSLHKLRCSKLVACLTDSCLSVLVYVNQGEQVKTVLCLTSSLLGESVSE